MIVGYQYFPTWYRTMLIIIGITAKTCLFETTAIPTRSTSDIIISYEYNVAWKQYKDYYAEVNTRSRRPERSTI